MRKHRIIISGGGTGGHIFPAIAIAQAIKKRNSNVEFLFVGAKDRMEMEKIPASGFRIEGLWISGFQRKITYRNFLFPFKIVYSIFRANQIIKDFQPDLAIGTGGYASGPLLFSASRKGIPSLIQEQNSYPGITNRILSKYVHKICVAYDGMERFFRKDKIVFTGNPIRKDILGFESRKVSGEEFFSIDKNQPTILVIGGSLGARSINNAIAEGLDLFQENNVNLIWQTGIAYKKKAEERVLEINKEGINAFSFIQRMDLAYTTADIIISRAGAIAISELCCIGKPVILVPSPNVSENHQYKNAQSLVNKNAALLVEDNQVSRKLVNSVMDLLKDNELQYELSNNIKNIAVKDAAIQIADIALDLIKE